jgi:hypothetical protein
MLPKSQKLIALLKLYKWAQDFMRLPLNASIFVSDFRNLAKL